MFSYIIRDEEGYWCGIRRGANKAPIHLFSTKRKDAARMHFYEVADRFARMLPQPVRIERVRDRA